MSRLIQIHTLENHIVFDPFGGMGTTYLSCIELKRKYIGCEINKNYYEKTLERIKKVQAQGRLDL